MAKKEEKLPQIEIQEVFLPLLTVHKRYKLYHGGRGGGKSFAFADALLLIARTKQVRVACIREVQTSIKDSVYQLLRDRCDMHGFDDYIFYEDRVVNSFTGSTIVFKGMNNNNAANIKSLEGINICWCFPAGTKIDSRNIEDIKVGDFVRSYNHSTGQIEYREVLRFMKRKCPDSLLRVSFSDGSEFCCTDEHPVYIIGRGYVSANKLKKGDTAIKYLSWWQKLFKVDYKVKVTSVKIAKKSDYVYNLEVQGNNNYFANGVLVHNCEEAQAISEKSWNILDPTIRKEGSEIWLSMNREEEYDPVWKAIAVNPTNDALVVKVNYYDNKFCPDTLVQQALRMKETDYLRYLHVWEGEPVQEGDYKLINLVDVRKAMDNKLDNSATDGVPLILGVDVARFGDDKTAIARRQGRKIFNVTTYANLSVTAVANLVKNIIHEEHPALVNIDVGGLGAGVYDILVQDGYFEIVRAVNFGENAQEPERFTNRRAEMWARVRDWLTAELPVSIVDCKGLAEDLTAPMKSYDKLGRLLLEKKADIKKRIGRSTDVGDAVALCFAEREYPRWLNVRSSWGVAEYADDSVYLEN